MSSGMVSTFPSRPLKNPSATGAAAAAVGPPRPFLNGVLKAACNYCVRCGAVRCCRERVMIGVRGSDARMHACRQAGAGWQAGRCRLGLQARVRCSTVPT